MNPVLKGGVVFYWGNPTEETDFSDGQATRIKALYEREYKNDLN